MDFTANRQELLAAVQSAEHIAPAASPVEILKCVCLDAENSVLTVVATNMETAVERKIHADIRENGRTAIDAKMLSEMLRLLGGDTVTFAQKERCLVSVKSGEAEYVVPVMDAGEYPRAEIPFPADTVTVSGIPDIAKRTAFAASENANEPLMRCVFLRFDGNGLNAVSTDGCRIASAKGDSKNTVAANLLIPAASLERLARLVTNKDELQVGVTGKTVAFMKESLLFSTRLMEGQYVNVDMVMKRLKPQFSVLTNAENVRNMVSSVCVVSGSQNRFKFSFQGGKLQAVCESEYGVSKMEMEVTALSGKPSGDCWLNPAKLLECLRAQKGTMTLEVTANGALIMRTEVLTCVQMLTREPKPVTRLNPATETAALKEAA